MKRLSVFVLTLIFLDLALPVDSQAIPAFARKYGQNCNMCHVAFTKLNDYGQRFRDNGYQVAGQEGKESNVIGIAPPLSLRLVLGYSAYINDVASTSGFGLYGFDLLAAGVLHKNVSFLLIYTPRIDSPASQYFGDSGASQIGSLESVSLVFSNLVNTALNIRVGRFEPGYHVFSSKRSFYLFEPYEIYTFTTRNNSYVFDDNQIGIEATGHYPIGFKYALGVVNGNGANPDNNVNKDIYLNVVQTFGKGDGQTAGQRIGAFGYLGWQPLDLPGTVISPTGETNGGDNKSFYRIGGTASFNLRTLNLQVLYMMGSDDKALNSLDSTKNYEYSGGFAELDYAGLLNNRLVASVLYNWITPPSYDSERQMMAYSALLRCYTGDWTAVNVAFHVEFTHRETGKDVKYKENMIGLALDFGF